MRENAGHYLPNMPEDAARQVAAKQRPAALPRAGPGRVGRVLGEPVPCCFSDGWEADNCDYTIGLRRCTNACLSATTRVPRRTIMITSRAKRSIPW